MNDSVTTALDAEGEKIPENVSKLSYSMEAWQ